MQPSHLLYRDFPVEISGAYGEVVRATDWNSRHEALLDLAETSLRHLATLTLSDYRSRSESPAPSVENLLERTRGRSLTLGRMRELLRASVDAVSDPLIPQPGSFKDCRLPGVTRFGAAFDSLLTAVDGLSPGTRPAAINVGVYAERGLSEGGKELDWWRAWERLIEYRNKVIHSSAHRWPIRSEGYWDVMGPLLHDALVEMLTQPAVSEPVLDHPVVNLTLISSDDSGRFTHSVCGEERGAWFEGEVVATEPITERWPDERWGATTASSYILERGADGEWSIRGLFWDLRNGLPPVWEPKASRSKASSSNGGDELPPVVRPPVALEGRGTAPGTCGEFAQGVLPDQTPFHVTCPINKSATVIAKLRAAGEFSVIGLSDYHRKMGLAIEYAVELFDLGAVEVTIRHWSDLDIGKGMGSSTADVLSGIRAIADAVDEELDASVEGKLAARVESSDGSMYPGIASVNHKTCELVKAWDWFPEFVIVMLVPHDSVDTHSISFAGQEDLAGDYEDLLQAMDQAIERRSIADFALQSTRSAALNERFLLNPYSRSLSSNLDEFDALGVDVGHTGTVCGLLFPNTDPGRTKASEACFSLRKRYPDLKGVKVVTTPHCETGPDGR